MCDRASRLSAIFDWTTAVGDIIISDPGNSIPGTGATPSAAIAPAAAATTAGACSLTTRTEGTAESGDEGDGD
jgi:hypothetical protein